MVRFGIFLSCEGAEADLDWEETEEDALTTCEETELVDETEDDDDDDEDDDDGSEAVCCCILL